MAPVNLQLQSWFASPVVLAQHPNPARMNGELETLFLTRETEEFRNKLASHIPQAELFESAFSVFKWPERCVVELRAFMLDNVGAAVAHLNGYKPEDMSKLTLQNHTWFHVMRHGASFVAHNHPNASWSAVYCVRAGEPVAGRPDSGALRFLDHRPGSNAFLDAGNSNMRREYGFGHQALVLVPGQLVIFPAYLVHEVATFLGRDHRITVAANCWFTTS
jgi:uncharacterized protein (TIGR02466 family)